MLGTVTMLRRYPVKSMLGEDVPASDVTGRGLAHDRALALIHTETGKVASAKNPRMWRGLLKLAAAVDTGAAAVDTGAAVGRPGAGVRITLPDGKILWSDDPGIDDVLSEVLGQPVTLTGTPPPNAELDRAVPEEVLRDGITARVAVETGQLGGGSPAGTFFDFAPIHLFTAATLDRIAELNPRGVAEVERYRPNIVIGTGGQGFAENDWAGHDLRIGSELTLRVMSRTPRCAIPTLEHGDLPRDSAALRVLADHNRVTPVEPLAPQPCAGAYAQVLHPGRIRVGDEVRLADGEPDLPARLTLLPTAHRSPYQQRFAIPKTRRADCGCCVHAWYVDADQVATLRALLAGSGWLERARIFGRALRTTPKSAGGLLVVGTPEYEPWHLTAHLDDESRLTGVATLAPTLVRWSPPPGAPPHLSVGLARLEAARRGETLFVVTEDSAPVPLLERLNDARKTGATILALDTGEGDPELDALAHEALAVPESLSFDAGQHLVSAAAAVQDAGRMRKPSLRDRLARLLDTVSGPAG